MNYFSSNTKFLKEKNGFSTPEIAAQLGIGRTTWIGYESGLSQPNISGLLKIVDLFDISVSDLLQKDLSNVHLNKNMLEEEQAEYVHPIVHPNVHLNTKKAPKGACHACSEKDKYIAYNEAIIRSNNDTIESQKVIIQLLQNAIETMNFTLKEREEMQHSTRDKRKSA